MPFYTNIGGQRVIKENCLLIGHFQQRIVNALPAVAAHFHATEGQVFHGHGFDDKKLLFAPAKILTQESGKCQLFSI